MHVLGINFSNDAAAALVGDGGAIAAVSEERFARVKHHGAWPAESIRFCLGHAGLGLADLDAVAFFWNPAAAMDVTPRAAHAWRHHAEYLSAVPAQLLPMLRASGEVSWAEQRFHFAGARRPLRVVFVTHHLAHAAAAFDGSPFEEAAVLTLDGYGERTTTLLQHATPAGFREVGRVEFPHSLGSLYAAFTQYLGFKPNGGEGKVMGLASYGRPRHADAVRRMVRLLPGGRYELDLAYFAHFLERPRRYTARLVEALGPEREPEGPLDERHMDVAASLQLVVEEAYDHLLAHLAASTGSPRLCLAGGVALNCVANGRAFFRSAFRDVYVCPAAGDNGAALGAAQYVLHHVEGRPRGAPLLHDLLGPDTRDDEVDAAVRASGAPSVALDGEALAAVGARLVAEGFIVGWYQGRAEFGPRALGARSILADPRRADMKDALNARVKFREWFRPFAPSVLAERAGEWFTPDHPSPFMLLCHDVRPEKRALVPAITHVDGTARVQTVARGDNPPYRALIEHFERLTGVPMVLDTSFNIRGEPIVNTPRQALQCFLTNDMDFLLLGRRLLWKGHARALAALAAVTGEAPSTGEFPAASRARDSRVTQG